MDLERSNMVDSTEERTSLLKTKCRIIVSSLLRANLIFKILQ